MLVDLPSDWTGRKWSKAILALVKAFLLFQAVGDCYGPDHDSQTVHWTTAILLGTKCKKWSITQIALLILLTVAKVAGHLVSTCKQTSPHISSSHPEQDSGHSVAAHQNIVGGSREVSTR